MSVCSDLAASTSSALDQTTSLTVAYPAETADCPASHCTQSPATSTPASASRRFDLLASLWLKGQVGLIAILTWKTWADVIVDFGRELYLPWQMNAGAVLYRDIAYFNGPFSPAWNSLWCALLGSSITTLITVNACLLLAMTMLAYHTLRMMASRTAACLAVTLFIWLCSGSQYLVVANYNWFCPYSHEMTHGLMLGWGSILCAWHATKRDSTGLLFVSGMLCGLVLLTKCEIGLAALAGTVTTLIPLLLRPQPGLQRVHKVIVWGSACLIPALIAIGLLRQWMPWLDAGLAVAGSWKHLLNSEVTANPYYRAVMGTDNLSDSLSLTYGWTVVYSSALLIGAWLGPTPTASRQSQVTRLFLIAFIITIPLAWGRNSFEWLSIGRPWPVLVALILLGTAGRIWKAGAIQSDPRLWLRLGLALFSLTLLLKIIFYARVFHYGFTLAAPALMLVVCAGWDWFPTLVGRRGGSIAGARTAFLCLAGGMLISHTFICASHLKAQTVEVGSRGNQMWADDRGELVNLLLRDIEQELAPGETICCLPEGTLINVISNHATGTRYINFVPADMLMFGESTMLSECRNHPPDWIALINRDTSEYGVRFFSRDYGVTFRAWIENEYETVTRYGGQPFVDHSPGYELKRRR